MGNAMASESEEGRSKRRNVTGKRKQLSIRKYPNGATSLMKIRDLLKERSRRSETSQ